MTITTTTTTSTELLNSSQDGMLNPKQAAPQEPPRTIAGKPVIERDAKTVLTQRNEAFEDKKLCDGLTLNLGDACVFRCCFCYVENGVRKYLFYTLGENNHMDVVVRRKNALVILREQLKDRHGNPRFDDPADTRVVYSSTLVDVGGNLELAMETAEACKIIFELTHWQVRLLTKSNLLPRLVAAIPEKWHQRLILGVSTGTLDDRVARAFELGTALPSKRIESLHWLQDRGFRTFGMICPSLPQKDYSAFAAQAATAIRVDRCEHVWAEPLNVRGESFKRTHAALLLAGLNDEAELLGGVSTQDDDSSRQKTAKGIFWEEYARATFLAHTQFIPPQKLRFLQYVKPQYLDWWKTQEIYGAVLLGKATEEARK